MFAGGSGRTVNRGAQGDRMCRSRVLVRVTWMRVLVLAMVMAWVGGVEATEPSGSAPFGIGSVQACLVAWYWMHMRRGDTAVTLSAFTTLFFMFIFFVLVLSDVLTRWRAAI